MPTKKLRSWRDIFSGKSGHVAVIWAFSILPIALVAGFAIDFQLITMKKNKAQYTLDAAVIAGSRMLQQNGSNDEVTLAVRDFFRQSMKPNLDILRCTEPSVTITGQDIEASTICSQGTTLSGIAGVDTVDFKVISGSTYGIGMIDVSFVFDVSGSMRGSRIEALKDAAVVAVDQLIPDDLPPERADDIRIAMVGYNNSLNAGDYFEVATGIEPEQVYTYWNSYYNRWYSIPYTTTCVFQRHGTQKFTDAAPGPDRYVTPANYWDQSDCRNSEPQALTTNKTTLKNYIEALDPYGGTAGHLGVAWGWYMISPEWTNILPAAPRAYDEPDTAKALILMTDGAFNATINNSQGSSTWQAKQLCDNIKAKGVVVYSVAFQAPLSGQEVLNYCASGEDYFFNPQDGQQLTQSYQAIASSISDLRITQ